MKTNFDKAVQFFLANAGFGYDPKKETPEEGRARCARNLAEAERDGVSVGLSFHWSLDGETNRQWTDEGDETPTWCCLVRDAGGAVVGALGGVDFGADEPSGPYRRVVEAELASEALREIGDKDASPCGSVPAARSVAILPGSFQCMNARQAVLVLVVNASGGLVSADIEWSNHPGVRDVPEGWSVRVLPMQLLIAARSLQNALRGVLDEFDKYDNAMAARGMGHEDYGMHRAAGRAALALSGLEGGNVA